MKSTHPTPPEVLDDNGRKEWEGLIRRLDPDASELPYLELYCLQYQHLLLCARHLSECGGVIARDGKLYPDSTFRLIESLLKTIRGVLGELGIEEDGKPADLEALTRHVSRN